jgi:hypothetical protein
MRFTCPMPEDMRGLLEALAATMPTSTGPTRTDEGALEEFDEIRRL